MVHNQSNLAATASTSDPTNSVSPMVIRLRVAGAGRASRPGAGLGRRRRGTIRPPAERSASWIPPIGSHWRNRAGRCSDSNSSSRSMNAEMPKPRSWVALGKATRRWATICPKTVSDTFMPWPRACLPCATRIQESSSSRPANASTPDTPAVQGISGRPSISPYACATVRAVLHRVPAVRRVPVVPQVQTVRRPAAVRHPAPCPSRAAVVPRVPVKVALNPKVARSRRAVCHRLILHPAALPQPADPLEERFPAERRQFRTERLQSKQSLGEALQVSSHKGVDRREVLHPRVADRTSRRPLCRPVGRRAATRPCSSPSRRRSVSTTLNRPSAWPGLPPACQSIPSSWKSVRRIAFWFAAAWPTLRLRSEQPSTTRYISAAIRGKGRCKRGCASGHPPDGNPQGIHGPPLPGSDAGAVRGKRAVHQECLRR